jgi:hypothetical protein
LFASQGLRGSFPALSGARNQDLPHWKPWLADGESETRKSRLLEKEKV